MAIPNAAITSPDLTQDISAAGVATVNGVDAGSYSPSATARTWKVDGVAVTPVGTVAVADRDDVDISIHEPGTYAVTLDVTNADGTDESNTLNAVITDPADAAYPVIPGTARVHPEKLPSAYRDPTIATPGPVRTYVALHGHETGGIHYPDPTLVAHV